MHTSLSVVVCVQGYPNRAAAKPIQRITPDTSVFSINCHLWHSTLSTHWAQNSSHQLSVQLEIQMYDMTFLALFCFLLSGSFQIHDFICFTLKSQMSRRLNKSTMLGFLSVFSQQFSQYTSLLHHSFIKVALGLSYWEQRSCRLFWHSAHINYCFLNWIKTSKWVWRPPTSRQWKKQAGSL